MDDQQSQNSRIRLIAAGIVVAIALAVGGWLWYRHAAATKPVPEPVAADPAPVAPVAVTPPADVPQHPLAPETASEPQPALPPVTASDDVITTSLRGVFGAPAVDQWLIPEGIARHLVATIDNLPRNAPLEKVRPVHAPAGPFGVERVLIDKSTGTERIELSAANFARYDAAVAVLQHADTKQLVAMYRHFYPLLQQAYEDLGYPEGYFNDRVIAAIDDMLRAPEVAAPIRLVQPKVLYQFEDANLEQLSAGQKLLIRMGPANATAVKTKLRELRGQIATAAPQK